MKRPDGDNLEKFLNDSLNGILWEDDARIVWTLRSKSYTSDKEGYTVVFATELGPSAMDYDCILEHCREHIEIT